MIDTAIDHGINYSIRPTLYHGGQSEGFVAKMLKPHREKLFPATKLPTWLVQGRDDFERILGEH